MKQIVLLALVPVLLSAQAIQTPQDARPPLFRYPCWSFTSHAFKWCYPQNSGTWNSIFGTSTWTLIAGVKTWNQL